MLSGIELSVRLPEERIWLLADLVRLAQVLANLLSNAAKYTEQGGQITLTAAARRRGAGNSGARYGDWNCAGSCAAAV